MHNLGEIETLRLFTHTQTKVFPYFLPSDENPRLCDPPDLTITFDRAVIYIQTDSVTLLCTYVSFVIILNLIYSGSRCLW